ncbi:minichromosome maintenance protein 10 [[Candida] railenensis]|uniref:Minichromosome maintenance protein 10 n=1 Tax=[Candida] railenensis TaxID=45579 RepID=A0A9P0QLT3_9ASCO|nr:minichromosome maintenance protein 10 [[Candida] railenensis]
MAYDDPRDVKEETILTESSDDELIDLQKEYEAKLQRLKEKKKLEKERKRNRQNDSGDGTVEISRSRSPSPTPGSRNTSRLGIWKKNEETFTVDKVNPNIATKEGAVETRSGITNGTRSGSSGSGANFGNGLRSTSSSGSKSSSFASSFQSTSKAVKSVDPIDREFSFNDIPEQRNIPVEEDSRESRDLHSSVTLRKRYYTPGEVDKLFSDKKILTIEKFFAKVYPPLFTEPQYPNWVLVGTLLSKGETKFTNDSKKSKYMKLSIGNFNNISVDILLFKEAYEKYWKLRVGDVIGILNPTIKPFRMSLNGSAGNTNTNQEKSPRGFNLVLDDSCDCIIEIGSARYFGFCKSIKKDGHRCSTPVDTKKTEYCNFHQELAIRKTGSKRMELNGSITMKSPSKSDGTRQAVYVGSKQQNNKKSTPFSGGIVTDYSQYKSQPDPNLYYSGKAFFKDEYTNPKMLENLAEKRRKLKDAREDDELIKNLNNIKSAASLRSLGLSKPSSKTSDSIITSSSKRNEKIAFNPNIVSKIGFNPAATSTIAHEEEIYKSPTKRRKLLSENIQELFELSSRSNSSKKLTASLRDKMDKKQKWDKNISEYQNYSNNLNSRLESSPFITSERTIQKPDMINSDADSNSDIEIEFTNDADRTKYTTMANGKGTIVNEK